MKLLPNTYKGLVWGLTHFDAIETDLRLSKDNQLVIFHDAFLESGEFIADLTLEELEEKGIPNLRTLISLQQMVELSRTKKMFLELKPNCSGKKRIAKEIAPLFFDALQEVIQESEIDPSSIYIISFSEDLLQPFVGTYPCYPLLPDVNECSQNFLLFKVMPQVLFKSMNRSMQEAVERGYAGVFFARQYIMGWTSWVHPNYSKMVNRAAELGLLLGTNLGTPELESDYHELARFSDKLSDYPRSGGSGGPIIAHRGTGTKGVEVPDEDVPELSIE